MRRVLKLQGGICCDGLVFYTLEGQNKKVLCLVELKASDIDHAVKQIITTYKHLKQALENSSSRDYLKQLTWKAYIHYHGSSQRQIKLCKTELERVFGKNNGDITRDKDLGPFLRKP